MKSRGLFIVVEGVDGAGKTSLAAALADALAARHEVVRTREPTDELDGSTADAYIADRRRHLRAIDAALRRGAVVICDRYTYSTAVYQGLDQPVQMMLRQADLRVPDLVLLLDVDAEVAAARCAARGALVGFDADSLAMRQRRVEAYRLLAAVLLHPIVRLDAAQSPETLLRRALLEVRNIADV